MFSTNIGTRRSCRAVFSVVAFCVATGAAQLYAQVAESVHKDPSRGVRQVSLSTAEGIVTARLEASRASQIRVTVSYFWVDDETRAKIYQSLPTNAIKTSVNNVTRNLPQKNLSERGPRAEGSEVIGTTSHVSTCVLDKASRESMLKMIAEAADSSKGRTQSILLLRGKDAEYSDISQRPFVVGADRVEGGFKPVVQVLDEGTTIRLNANLTESPLGAPPRIELRSELGWRKILNVKTEQVFGIEEGATSIQVPTHVVKSAVAAELLSEGESLLVDPYVVTIAQRQNQSDTSVLSKIPYFGTAFANIAGESVNQNVMVLLQPAVE